VRKGHRTRRSIGLALLFLLIASLLGLQFLTRGASGLPDPQPGSSQRTTTKGTDHGPANGPVAGAAGASTLAFTHDFDGVHSLGASGSRDDYSQLVGGQSDSETRGAGVGSGNLAGAGDVGPAGGSPTSGGSGNLKSDDPGSSVPGTGATPFVPGWQSSPGGAYGGPFGGGGGAGGSGGPRGAGGPSGPSGSSGSGGSSGAGGPGGRDGKIPEAELFLTGTDLGGGEGGDPAAPIPSSVATVPGPPTILLVVAGVGMLWGTTKVRRVRCR
jgi:hypothetical protein